MSNVFLSFIGVALLVCLALIAVWLVRIFRQFQELDQRIRLQERLLNALYQEKALQVLEDVQRRIRFEHDSGVSAGHLPDQFRRQADDLLEEADKNFSTALTILREARRMYDERLKILDRLPTRR